MFSFNILEFWLTEERESENAIESRRPCRRLEGRRVVDECVEAGEPEAAGGEVRPHDLVLGAPRRRRLQGAHDARQPVPELERGGGPVPGLGEGLPVLVRLGGVTALGTIQK